MCLAREEPHHVGALEVIHGVPHQLRVETGQGARILEEQVGGPLGLVRRPVVVHRPRLEDSGVLRVEDASDGGEGARPVEGELLVHEALGECDIPQRREAVVVALEVARALAPELLSKPLTTVEADLNVEREPGLQAGAHEAKPRMEEVLVDVEALAGTQPEPALVAVRRHVVLEGDAGLQRGQDADEPFLDGGLGEKTSCEILLADRARCDVADRTVEALRLGQRRGLDALGGVGDVLLEVEQSHTGTFQEVEHPVLAPELQQRSAKHKAVEAGQNASDQRAETRYESLHGVLLGQHECFATLMYPMSDAAVLSVNLGCGRQPAL